MPKATKIPVSEIQRLAGRRLRAVRELAGVKQEALCERLRIDQSTWSKYEQGKRTPGMPVMIEFAARFDVSLDFIFRGLPVGMHPELVKLMRLGHPDLLTRLNPNKSDDPDAALSTYRGAIDPVGAG